MLRIVAVQAFEKIRCQEEALQDQLPTWLLEDETDTWDSGATTVAGCWERTTEGCERHNWGGEYQVRVWTQGGIQILSFAEKFDTESRHDWS